MSIYKTTVTITIYSTEKSIENEDPFKLASQVDNKEILGFAKVGNSRRISRDDLIESVGETDTNFADWEHMFDDEPNRRTADIIDGMNRDDLGESPDY